MQTRIALLAVVFGAMLIALAAADGVWPGVI